MYFFSRFIVSFFMCFDDFVSRKYVIGENHFVRNRKMNFKQYIVYILVQRSCSDYSEAINYFTRMLKNDFETITRQAIGKQREFISYDLYIDLSERFIDSLYNKFKVFSKFKGYTICACDGSIFQLPNNKKTKEEWGVKKDTVFKKHNSRARVSCILDVNSKLILTAKIASKKINENKLAIEHLNNLKNRFNLKKVITIYDRGYVSEELMLNTIYLESKFLIRLRKNIFAHKIKRMSLDDGIIRININNNVLKKIKDEKVKNYAKQLERLEIRVVKVILDTGEVEILATNLDENEFTSEELKELYSKRWSIETGYDRLKNLIQIEEFSGLNEIKIKQDFYANIFIYNLSTIIKIDATKIIMRQPRNRENKYSYNPNFSSIISLIFTYLYELINEPRVMKEITIDFMILKSSKELSQVKINENNVKKRKKPDITNKHSGFKKKPM